VPETLSNLPQAIYLDREVQRTPYVEQILANFSRLPVHVVKNIEEVGYPNSLVITNFKGRFLKPCPGTRNYICCDYWVLNFATGCLLDCAYCILHSYLNAQTMRLYANVDQMQEEIDRMVEGKKRTFRIGTGELTDSLLLDNKIRFSEKVISHLLQFDNVVVELKTKTLNLDSVKSLGPHPNLVISWSLNAPDFAEIYEAKSPTIRQRIEAAAHLRQLGFRIGIHFDPLIYSAGWEEQYTKTLDFMRDKLGELAWISLGAFRGPPGLKKILGKSDMPHTLLLEEFVRGKDGKMRYFRPIRVRMYRFMKERLEAYFPGTPIYLCMESPEVWKSVFGWFPKNNKELGDWLVKTTIG